MIQCNLYLYIVLPCIFYFGLKTSGHVTESDKVKLREKTKEMFHHAYSNYMEHAYPADELMPLSCKGRYRGSEPSRGDIDDSLGNFSLTLIDTLDTLAVIGEFDFFEDAVIKVIRDVTFDTDVVVSVFETNIRVLGGLLGGHTMATYIKQHYNRMRWYDKHLLVMAEDLADRLLPAFNTSTGMPYPRVNLKYGIVHAQSRTGHEKDTCTSCAGTIILEFSALSRLTRNNKYELTATRAMDYLWSSRHHSSDLVGTVINIHNGDWIRKDSGVGAGIDSYYEYLLKAYIMLGDDTYLERFNKHYKAIMKYINNGPLMLDVHMHRPQTTSRNFMDSLFAFWPGLQVLKGDLKPAIEIHEMLYQVLQRHNFLPEAFTSDFRVHWAQHPLRPEFLESTYFLYKATNDPYYLEVGKTVLENLNRFARVDCGFAAFKDITTNQHEDQMDSFVFAETFKYLHLLFSDESENLINIDEFIFTTEAHLLPLFLSPHSFNNTLQQKIPKRILDEFSDEIEEEYSHTCPSNPHLDSGIMEYATKVRSQLKNMVENVCPKNYALGLKLKASDFSPGNADQLRLLNRMGIKLVTMNDGRVQLVHVATEASSVEEGNNGLIFMQEMIQQTKTHTNEVPLESRYIRIVDSMHWDNIILKAGPAQFGSNFKDNAIEGQLVMGDSIKGCHPPSDPQKYHRKFVMIERGDCMFIEKARFIQEAGGIGTIIYDNNSESSGTYSPFFSMSGDGRTDVNIPVVFIFTAEAKVLRDIIAQNPKTLIHITDKITKYTNPILEAKQKLDKIKRLLDKITIELDAIPFKHEFTSEKLHPTISQIIANILDELNLHALHSHIRKRGSNKYDADITGANIVKVISLKGNQQSENQNVETISIEQSYTEVDEQLKNLDPKRFHSPQLDDPTSFTSPQIDDSTSSNPDINGLKGDENQAANEIIEKDINIDTNGNTLLDINNVDWVDSVFVQIDNSFDTSGGNVDPKNDNTMNQNKGDIGEEIDKQLRTSDMTNNQQRFKNYLKYNDLNKGDLMMKKRIKFKIADDRHDEQKLAEQVMGELMLLLYECTNIRSLREFTDDEEKAEINLLPRFIESIARLVERRMTNGLMQFGIQTEINLNLLRNSLHIDDRCMSSLKNPQSLAAASLTNIASESTTNVDSLKSSDNVDDLDGVDLELKRLIELEINRAMKEAYVTLVKKEKSTDCDSALIPLLCVHG